MFRKIKGEDGMKRIDDFNERRRHLADLSDEELYDRFWELTEKIVGPMVELAKKNTSPAIERSVLLRMGFSSIEADNIVKYGLKWGLLGYGMGHGVLCLAENNHIDYLEAGRLLSIGKGWETVNRVLRGN